MAVNSFVPIIADPDLSVGPSFDGDGLMVAFPVSECPADGRTVLLVVRLSPMPDFGPDMHEFSFLFLVDYDAAQPAFETQDRNIARKFLPGDVPSRIIDWVGAAAIRLLEAVHPVQVYRVSKVANLPAKALTKHDRITSYFLDAAYHVVERGTNPYRRPFWLMEREA